MNERWRSKKANRRARLDEAFRNGDIDALLTARLADVRVQRENEIAWAAGIFEGEGSWGCYDSKLRATIVLGDEDVLRRFAAAVGAGPVSPVPNTPDGNRPLWRWSLSNAAVVELALLLWPYLGERRRAVFCEKMREREEFIAGAVAPRECEGCGGEFSPPYSKMASRTRFCSDVCRQRAKRRIRREAA